MTAGHIAVIDIGKTNAKLALVEVTSLTELAVATRPNTVLPGPPWPHFDVEGHWEFILDALGAFHRRFGVDAISVTTHGASLALIGADGGLAAPVLDYEHSGPDEVASAYDAIRPAFDETGSPRLAMGLNAGAQLFWQFGQDPDLRERVRWIVTYPQYWTYRLTGVAATEVTSLGCHTDLWNPTARRVSSLVERLGIEGKLAPLRRADEVLGSILPAVAARTGLPADTPVYCGIHDSNASLLPHLLSRQPPFGVVSSGTWVISMAIDGEAITLDPSRDTLINVNAFGDPVPSARFMGGREHDLAKGGMCPEPSDTDIREVLDARAMLLPALVPETGPFRGRQAEWLRAPDEGTGQRAAAVAFYLALVTARCLDLVGQRGAIVLEGPFSQNRALRMMLAAASGKQVIAMGGATGTSQGAALLVTQTAPPGVAEVADTHVDSALSEMLSTYASEWRDRVGG